MKNIFKLNYLLFAVLTLFVFTACEDDEAIPEEENEEEVITDVTLIFNKKYVDNVIIKKTDKNFKEKIFFKKCISNFILYSKFKVITPIISEKSLVE